MPFLLESYVLNYPVIKNIVIFFKYLHNQRIRTPEKSKCLQCDDLVVHVEYVHVISLNVQWVLNILCYQ